MKKSWFVKMLKKKKKEDNVEPNILSPPNLERSSFADTGNTIFQRSTSFQTQTSTFSSQTSVQRVETKTRSTGTPFPLTQSTTFRSVENTSPTTKQLQIRKPSLQIDARPFDHSITIGQPSTRTIGYQSPFQRSSTVYSSLRTTTPSQQRVITPAPPSVTNGNEISQNRDPRIPTYSTSGRKRGKALIINNIKFMKDKQERKGAEVDEKRMSEMFRKFGFEVKVYRNLKRAEMNEKLNKFISDKTLASVDISAVIMMSHGHNSHNGKIIRGGYTEIVGIDNESLPIDDVIGRFDSGKCPVLMGKPKIFIFQCCRGDNQEEIHVDATPIVKVTKQHADMLIAFSTLPGFFSLRDPVRGSWYIQSICDVFERHAKEFDVETLLKIVDEELSKKHPQYQQTSTYESRGFKRCYLNPLS
nr:caspase-7-like isoform X2 [Leptinotarsa decemlineata]